MGKIRDLLDQSEKQRYEFYQVGDKVHQVSRTPEQHSDKHGHRRTIHNADGTEESQDWISPEEYEKLRKEGTQTNTLKGGK
jgi:hypothetical protein